MSEYTRSHLALWSQLDLLGAIGFAVAALALFALARQYYLLFAVPSAIQVRPWVPMPDDLPQGPVDPYGARALKATYQPSLFTGVNGSVGLHVMLIVSLLVAAKMMEKPSEHMPRPDREIPFPGWVSPPPPLNPEVPDARAYSVEPMEAPKLETGVVIPVADHTVSLNTTILAQNELGDLVVTGFEVPDGSIWVKRGGPRTEYIGPGGYGLESDLPVSPHIVERLPELVTIPDPVYPVLAKESGAEGVVRLNVLVGRDGRVKDARIVESIPMLDEPALNSARAAVFRPALWNGSPVSVWVTIPIRFSLRDR